MREPSGARRSVLINYILCSCSHLNDYAQLMGLGGQLKPCVLVLICGTLLISLG
jgi:hypothetical protein